MSKYRKKIEEAKLLMAEEAGNVDQVKQEMQAEKAALEEAWAQQQAAEDSDDSDKFDNEEDGGEWVTDQNLYSHIGGADASDLMENQDNSLFTQIKTGNTNPEETKDEAQEVKAEEQDPTLVAKTESQLKREEE